MLKVINGGKEPTKGSKYSACIDLYANADVVIGAGETVIVPLGVCIDEDEMANSFFLQYPDLDYEYNSEYFRGFLERHYLALHPRSSLRAKGLIANVGVIDLDYRDEIKMIVHNPLVLNGFGIDEYNGIHLPDNQIPYYEIKKGEKIAQIMLVEHKGHLFGIETDAERNGGFGSTGR